MPMLTALRRQHYAGRPLNPGDVFDAKPKDAKFLKGIGYAKDAGEFALPSNVTDLPPKPAEEFREAMGRFEREPDDITALRGDYESIVGKRASMRWNATTLRTKIAEYGRKDMRAED